MRNLIKPLLFVFGLIAIGSNTLKACGTVPMWFEQYKKASDNDDRLNALKFLCCETIVKDYSKNKKEQNPTLIAFLEQVIHDLDSNVYPGYETKTFVQDLVMKNLIRFDLINEETFKASPEIRIYLEKMATSLHVSFTELKQNIKKLPPSSILKTDEGLNLDNMAYAIKLQLAVHLLGRE